MDDERELQVIRIAVHIIGGEHHPVGPRARIGGEVADIAHFITQRNGVTGMQRWKGDFIKTGNAQIGEIDRRGGQHPRIKNVVAVESGRAVTRPHQRKVMTAFTYLNLCRIVARHPVGLRHQGAGLRVKRDDRPQGGTRRPPHRQKHGVARRQRAKIIVIKPRAGTDHARHTRRIDAPGVRECKRSSCGNRVVRFNLMGQSTQQ